VRSLRGRGLVFGGHPFRRIMRGVCKQRFAGVGGVGEAGRLGAAGAASCLTGRKMRPIMLRHMTGMLAGGRGRMGVESVESVTGILEVAGLAQREWQASRAPLAKWLHPVRVRICVIIKGNISSNPAGADGAGSETPRIASPPRERRRRPRPEPAPHWRDKRPCAGALPS
jgi:hypothetical protein